MLSGHARFQRRLLLCVLAAAAPLGAGCAAACLSEVGWVCGPGGSFDRQYNLRIVSRNGKPDLFLYVKEPVGQSNRKALLVAHSSSTDTYEAALLAALQWGNVFAPLGYTIVAHAYNEAESGYGQYDLEDTLDAIDWLNGPGVDELGVDRVYLQGTSRGGIIAYQAAYRCGPDKLAAVLADRGVSNFLLMDVNADAYIAGAFGSNIQRAVELTLQWIGVTPDESPEPWMQISAAYNIEHIGVPLLVLHGDRDVMVPFEQALDFQERVRQAGRHDIEFYLVEGRGHLDLGFEPDFRAVVQDFLERH
ncbi:MAG: prolyl oligopeptidase family serine peptidase [Phycisphaerales bacterium]|nr:MAG: prolyl oligopeptidase family serine peptidase [Phycisphaerales bacterium]